MPDSRRVPDTDRIPREEWAEYALGLLGVVFLIGLMGTAITCISVTFYG